jgi:hypothetical protein
VCPWLLVGQDAVPHSYVYPFCCSNHSRVAVDTGVADRRPETVVAALCFSLPTLLPCTM